VTELQQNRYDQLLRRVGDLKGPGSKVNDVLQELFPTLDVENVPGELLFLMGTRIGWAATSVAPGAANRAGIQLFNPVDSGHLVTVSRVLVSGSVTTGFTWGLTVSAFGTNTGIPRLRDGRVGVGPAGVSELRTTVAGVALSSGLNRVLSNTTFEITDENSVCVLSPGIGMSVVADTDDRQINVSFFYRERIAEPSELTF